MAIHSILTLSLYTLTLSLYSLSIHSLYTHSLYTPSILTLSILYSLSRKWQYYLGKELWVKEESKHSQKCFDLKTWQLVDLELDLSQEERIKVDAFRKIQQGY